MTKTEETNEATKTLKETLKRQHSTNKALVTSNTELTLKIGRLDVLIINLKDAKYKTDEENKKLVSQIQDLCEHTEGLEKEANVLKHKVVNLKYQYKLYVKFTRDLIVYLIRKEVE